MATGMGQSHVPSPPKGAVPDQYLALFHEYLYEGDYNACLEVCDTLEKYWPKDGRTYAYRTELYRLQYRLADVVTEAKRAIRINPEVNTTHEVMIAAQLAIGHAKEAKKSIDTAASIGLYSERLYNLAIEANAKSRAVNLSHVSVALILTLWILCAVILYAYRKQKGYSGPDSPSGIGALQMVLIPASVTFLFYCIFFWLAPWIRSGNTYYPPQEFSPCVIRDATFDHDGREGYVLYVMVMAIVSISALAYWLVSRIRNQIASNILTTLLGIASMIFLVRVGFYPPCSTWHHEWVKFIFLTLLYCLVVWLLTQFYVKYPRLSLGLIVISLVPICFLCFAPLQMYDYGYILSPALRLYHGVRIPDIYFQYDLYLSLMALAFFKAGIAIHKFQLVAQAGYYIFFVAIFLFARRFFQDRRLPFLMLVFLLVMRFYANIDPIGSFQITPWRLDLWLVLLILVYWRGAYHWSIGLFLGLLLTLHRNFALIYTAAYIQFLIVLSLAECVRAWRSKDLFQAIRFILIRCLPNVVLIALFFAVSYVVLGGFIPESALSYQRIGIGMTPITGESFYWYVIILLCLVVMMLIRNFHRISERYFVTSIFLILLSIGNSLYFFGRSHEHNIINLMGTLSFCLFAFIDLLGMSIRDVAPSDSIVRIKRIFYFMLPVFSIGIAIYFYAGSISDKLADQRKDVEKMQILYPGYLGYDFQKLRSITDSSDKVFFLEFYNDFLYYYQGQYKPMGYFNPNDAWVLKKDMAQMLQQLLDDGYYIAVVNFQDAREFLCLLDYNGYRADGDARVYYKKPYKSVLNTHGSFYRSFSDPIPWMGIETRTIGMTKDFTAECIFKLDSGTQTKGAVIYSNLHTTIDKDGMQVVLSDTSGGFITFSCGTGSELITSPPLSIDRLGVNYIATTVSHDQLTIEVNGKEAFTAALSHPVTYSEQPVRIGNSRARDLAVRGRVYEVAISDTAVSAARISQTEGLLLKVYQ